MGSVNEKNLVLTRAQGAVLSRDFPTAARLYKQLLKDDPSNIDYLKEIGAIYVKAGEDEKAVPYYEQIITFYPHYIDAMNSLGAIFRRLKRYEESIEILQRAADEGRQSASVNYNLGFTYKEMGNFDDAIDAFESVIGENPTDVLAHNHLGCIYLSQKQYQKSITAFKRGLQIDQNHPILNYNLACCYRDAKQYTDAIRYYEAALRVKPGWIDAIKDYSNLLIQCQKTKEASDLVKHSIELHPNDSKLLSILGKIYLEQYDYEGAAKVFKRANSVDDKDVSILSGLAEALEKSEKPLEALDAVCKAIEIAPENKDVKKQYVHTLLSAEEYDSAQVNVQSLYSDNGQDDPQVLDLYGQYCICVDDEIKAGEYFNKIGQVNKLYKDHLLSAASRYSQKGNFTQAERFAKDYIAKNVNNPTGYNVLGQIYSKEGNMEQAIESFAKSQNLKKPNILAEKQISSLKKQIEMRDEVKNIPVEDDVLEEESVITEEIAPKALEEDRSDDSFDFGSMGDNVPMGEALLEKENDFFDDLDKELEEDGIEADIPDDSDSISPFQDFEKQEPKSTAEQLVPDADFSDYEDFDYSKPKKESEPVVEPDTEAESFTEPVAEPSFMPESFSEPKNDFERESFGEPRTKSEPKSEPDVEPETKSEPKSEPCVEPETKSSPESESYAEPKPQSQIQSEPQPEMAQNHFDENNDTVPSNYNNSNGFGNNNVGSDEINPFDMAGGSGKTHDDFSADDMINGIVGSDNFDFNQFDDNPVQYEKAPYSNYNPQSMFAREVEQRAREAGRESAQFAMDTAMNAQRLAQQLANEQKTLQDKLENLNNEYKENKEAFEKILAEKNAVSDKVEPFITNDSQVSDEVAAGEKAIDDIVATEEVPIDFDKPETIIDPQADTDFYDSSFGEYSEEDFNVSDDISQEAEESFAFDDELEIDTDDIFVEPATDDIPEIDSTFNTETISPDTACLVQPMEANINEEESVGESEDTNEELELFKKLRSLCDFVPDSERQTNNFDSMRARIEYIISKMSGKKGLLKVAEAYASDDILEECINESVTEGVDLELIVEVLGIMKKLAVYLEDQSIAKTLCAKADQLLKKITISE